MVEERTLSPSLLLKDLISDYQSVIKEARNFYFSQLIAALDHNHRISFKTINSVIEAQLYQIAEFSSGILL